MAKKPMKSQPCPVCGATMRYEKRAEILEYKGRTKKVDTLGFWCTGCGEGILTGRPLAARERAFLSLKAETENQIDPRRVAAIRKKLDLSKRDAGLLLGGSPHVFEQYESGEVAVGVPMAHLLRLLDQNPELLGSLIQPKLAKAQPVSEKQWSAQDLRIEQVGPGRSRSRRAMASR